MMEMINGRQNKNYDYFYFSLPIVSVLFKEYKNEARLLAKFKYVICLFLNFNNQRDINIFYFPPLWNV